MNEAREEIAQRFIEAADTELRLPPPRARPAGFGSPWPSYVHTVADMNGWGTERLAEERRLISRRLPPSADAISRHEECLVWTAEIIPEDRRHLVWAWAFSLTSGRSFRGWCRARGMAHTTAINRVNRVFDLISIEIRRNGGSMRHADVSSVGPIDPESAIGDAMIGDRMAGATVWRADDAIPVARPDMWERKKISEARRRALLGVG